MFAFFFFFASVFEEKILTENLFYYIVFLVIQVFILNIFKRTTIQTKLFSPNYVLTYSQKKLFSTIIAPSHLHLPHPIHPIPSIPSHSINPIPSTPSHPPPCTLSHPHSNPSSPHPKSGAANWVKFKNQVLLKFLVYKSIRKRK